MEVEVVAVSLLDKRRTAEEWCAQFPQLPSSLVIQIVDRLSEAPVKDVLESVILHELRNACVEMRRGVPSQNNRVVINQEQIFI